MPRHKVVRGASILACLLAAGLVAGTSQAAAPASANQGATWADIAKLPDINGVFELARGAGTTGGRRQTPAVLTPAADARLKAYKAAGIQDAQTANCLPPGMPQIMDQPYPIEVLVTPKKVTIIQEAYMQVRSIFVDGRKLPDDPDLTFNGASVGHWEGDTLVVDTVGLAPEVELGDGIAHSDKVHMIERIRLSDPNMLEVSTRIEDPEVLAKPWEYVSRYARHRDWSLAEYICEQNNRNSIDASGKSGINLKN